MSLEIKTLGLGGFLSCLEPILIAQDKKTIQPKLNQQPKQ